MPIFNSAIDLYMTYQFLKRLTTPFSETEAFKLGLIDDSGKKLKSPNTSNEHAAWGYFDRLVFNLKKLISAVPFGKTKLASYAAALFMIREQNNRYINDHAYLAESFEGTMRQISNQQLPDLANLHEVSTALARLEKFMKKLEYQKKIKPKPINEFSAANAVGGGNVAGLGVGSSGEPGGANSRVVKMIRRRLAKLRSDVM